MDVRDFSVWVQEAKRRALMRRSDLYEAALLPNQKVESIRRAVTALDSELWAVDHEDVIEKTEAMAQKRLIEMQEKRKAKEARAERSK